MVAISFQNINKEALLILQSCEKFRPELRIFYAMLPIDISFELHL
jgi:hypothetical protein